MSHATLAPTALISEVGFDRLEALLAPYDLRAEAVLAGMIATQKREKANLRMQRWAADCRRVKSTHAA